VYAHIRDKINRELYEKNVTSGSDVAVSAVCIAKSHAQKKECSNILVHVDPLDIIWK